ncbi:hypothetical protein BB559_004547 [Furculomyces boomerangus]|uniref:ER membrane protein complex subunit 10 n=2 Tax=Harpellales TaxID=61421 RepID=A0A2T9YE05_9FUNG|nr:hypothetical protein BB559_004547 [Furculomyces boomerangus]PWA01418.1 hypothetical protein BB558_002486 [Smittium angustum]
MFFFQILTKFFISLIILYTVTAKQLHVYRRSLESKDQFEYRGLIDYDFEKGVAEYSSTAHGMERFIEINTKVGVSNDLETIAIVSDTSDFTQVFSVPKGLVESVPNKILEEEFGLYFNRMGKLVNADYSVQSISGALKQPKQNNLMLKNIKTRVSVLKTKYGPEPHLLRAATIDTRTGKVQVEESKSFFVKYWYIIVPVVLFLLLSPQGE